MFHIPHAMRVVLRRTAKHVVTLLYTRYNVLPADVVRVAYVEHFNTSVVPLLHNAL